MTCASPNFHPGKRMTLFLKTGTFNVTFCLATKPSVTHKDRKKTLNAPRQVSKHTSPVGLSLADEGINPAGGDVTIMELHGRITLREGSGRSGSPQGVTTELPSSPPPQTYPAAIK
jgi:hypothetical protein